MRVLIVLTSPFGDIVDTLPALTDAKRALPDITFDWVVESAYQEIPSWHHAVNRVIPTAIRRWRKHFWQTINSPEWRQFKTQLRKDHYDLVIDCQGLIKSAVIGKLVKAPVVGFDRSCIREKAAAWFYQRSLPVDPVQPRIEKMRELFARALNYSLPNTPPDFGIDRNRFCGGVEESPYIVFVHSASRPDKMYPEDHWQAVISQLSHQDIRIRLPWGSDNEKARAERLAVVNAKVQVLPKLNLQGLACVLVQAKAVVSVNTGLGNLSVALGVPTVSLYNSVSCEVPQACGSNQIVLQDTTDNDDIELAMSNIDPRDVANAVNILISKRSPLRATG